MHENGQPRQGIGALENGACQVNRYGAVRQTEVGEGTSQRENLRATTAGLSTQRSPSVPRIASQCLRYWSMGDTQKRKREA